MGIRFRKYIGTDKKVVTAIKLTEKNVEEVVAYINKNKGTAIDETQTFYDPELKDGQYTAVKIAIVQKNVDAKGRVKKGVRKAFGGDLIVRNQVVNTATNKVAYEVAYEFSRIRDAGIDGYSLV